MFHMSRATRFAVSSVAAVLSASAASAQSGADTLAINVSVSAEEAFRAIPRQQRPRLAIKDFEFQAQLAREDQDDMNSYAAAIAAWRGRNAPQLAESNGVRMAKSTSQFLTERLRNTNQFRVYEREQLGTITGEQDLAASSRARQGQAEARTGELLAARYVVTGAITKFGKSKKKKGGIGGAILGRIAGGVALNSSQTDYEVGITVKVVESSTGEVVAAATTDGVVSGDTERSLAGLGGTWGAVAGGAFSRSATGEREKRITEALQRAIDLVVLQVVQARLRGDLEP
jgi:curli biogenesis system outer membrane secretion channel CsgG